MGSNGAYAGQHFETPEAVSRALFGTRTTGPVSALCEPTNTNVGLSVLGQIQGHGPGALLRCRPTHAQ